MKKKTKIMITIISAVIVIAVLVLYLVPMFLLKAATKKVLPNATRAEYITDFDLEPQNSMEVDNVDYTIEIPAHLSKMDYDIGANCYASADNESKIIMFTKPYDEEMSLVNPEDYKDDVTMKKYGIKNVEKMYESLGYGRPDSYYNIMKAACLVDWEDYNAFSVRKSVAFSVYAFLRAELYLELDNYLYERDEVRAIIQAGEEGKYQVELFHIDNLNGSYTIMINDKYVTLEDVTAMLNTVEFK